MERIISFFKESHRLSPTAFYCEMAEATFLISASAILTFTVLDPATKIFIPMYFVGSILGVISAVIRQAAFVIVLCYEDPRGKYKSVYGDPLTRVVCKTTKDFRKEVAINNSKKLFESDINPIFQCLSENYLNQDAPKLNIAFFDIETDFDPDRGFADPSDPFMPVTSISVYLQWMETMVCLAVPPKTLTMDEAKKTLEGIDNVMLFEKEGEMIDTFLKLIEDADILSGWNSEGYDIPYLINRTSRVLSKDDTRRFCLWKQLPKKREFEKYGKTAETYDLVGRVHLDSLNLYRKYTYEERHSYRLDAIGEVEIGETKVPYEGTLDQLYNN